jgi:hypothetical protein
LQSVDRQWPGTRTTKLGCPIHATRPIEAVANPAIESTRGIGQIGTSEDAGHWIGAIVDAQGHQNLQGGEPAVEAGTISTGKMTDTVTEGDLATIKIRTGDGTGATMTETMTKDAKISAVR